MLCESISEHIENKFGVSLSPGRGKNGPCVFCGKNTMSIPANDTIAHCFHPNCGKTLTLYEVNKANDPYQSMIQRIFEPCKTELEKALNTPGFNKPVDYLTRVRNIHPDVIKKSMLGIPPADYEHYVYKLILETEENIKVQLENISEDKDKSFLNNMSELIYKLKLNLHLFSAIDKNVIFAYTDQKGYIAQLKARVPDKKDFITIKFYKSKTGVFKSFLSKNPNNDNIIIVEGEFNALQMQSLAARNNEDYFNVVAVGGVDTTDYKVLKEI